MPERTDRGDWKSVVVRPGDDREALERSFDAATPTTVAERLELAWQLSVAASRLAGWGADEQGLSRSPWRTERR